jgi:hypothetical protein
LIQLAVLLDMAVKVLVTAVKVLCLGQQAAGTGGMYERMATDPMSMQAYMSPYMQNVIEIQKQQAIEDAQRAQLGANLGAARQGTYGGARQTLAQTQREAALNKQLSDIQAQGLQSAFDQAQKSQQFGVTSGLQGLQAGILALRLVFKVLAWGFKVYKVLKLGLGFLEEWVNKLQILVRHNNKQILVVLDFSVILQAPNNNDNKTLLTSRSRTLRLRKKCQPKGWLATTRFFVVMQRLHQLYLSIRRNQAVFSS